MANKAIGMNGDDNRSRNNEGRAPQKRSDTYIDTIELHYGRLFGVRSDMHLGNFLERSKAVSLHLLLQSKLLVKKQ